MPTPRNKKEVQSLTSKLAALTRFLSKSAEGSLPFFGTLKNCLKKTDFKWTEVAEVAFQEMKKLLKELSTMTAPIAGETLILYLATSKEAISSVLIANRGRKRIKLPCDRKTGLFACAYSQMLKEIFPSVSNNGLNGPTNKAENFGRMAKWAIELGEHEISFSPISAVKGQVLVDYLAEIAGDIKISHEPKEIRPPPEQLWEIHTDGPCGPKGAGTGIVLKSTEREEYTFVLRFSFPVTNNEDEYEALLSRMRVAKYLEVKELSVYVDSQLVANQFNGIFEAHDESMQKYLKLVQELTVDFDIFQIMQVSRTLNKKADALSKLAALTFSHFKKEIWVEEVKVKSIDTDGVSAAVEEDEPSWMTPIVEFLNTGTVPIDSIEARKIKMKAPMYLLDKGILYRKSFLGPHLQCLNPTQAESIIREMHEGMCALHSGHKTVASKIMRLGYYWPSMYIDAAEFGIHEIVSDNGTQFDGNPFNDWCQELNIKQTFTSVAHPQANGQCEVTNRDIVLGEAEDTGKFGPKWEGPYKVIGVSDTWAYRLAGLDGKAINRTWHAQTLKRCYI
ncbi:uncharacterized protein [Rutidosis leptorrhynchoides]|uniref:uncharacterized protein n=1 Tax=Rutidosis leptorrhynchoides TaxID=125765 RepID=UPI003A9912F7